MIEKEVDELGFFGGGREVDIMEQQNAPEVGYPQRRRVKVGLKIFRVVVHSCDLKAMGEGEMTERWKLGKESNEESLLCKVRGEISVNNNKSHSNEAI